MNRERKKGSLRSGASGMVGGLTLLGVVLCWLCLFGGSSVLGEVNLKGEYDLFRRFWLGAELFDVGVASGEGGVRLELTETSEAFFAGLRDGDVVRTVNDLPIEDVGDFVRKLTRLGSVSVELELSRGGRELQLSVSPSYFVDVEVSNVAREFERIPLPSSTVGEVSVSGPTMRDPLDVLTDCRLLKGYGPIFLNGAEKRAYRMDLGTRRSIEAINSWSISSHGRERQLVSFYGCGDEADPGWDLEKYIPIGSLDTGDSADELFLASSLRGREGMSLGEYRWVVWSVVPVRPDYGGEYTSFQELSVEVGE